MTLAELSRLCWSPWSPALRAASVGDVPSFRTIDEVPHFLTETETAAGVSAGAGVGVGAVR